MVGLKSKKGIILTPVVIFMSLMYPLIQLSLIDIGGAAVIREKLRTEVIMSAKAAASCVSWDEVYDGNFRLNTDLSSNSSVCGSAPKALYEIMKLNNAGLSTDDPSGLVFIGNDGNILRYEGIVRSGKGDVYYYAEIFNEADGSSVILGGSRIPDTIIADNAVKSKITVYADKPAVFIIAKKIFKPFVFNIYRLSGTEIELVEYSSCELKSVEARF